MATKYEDIISLRAGKAAYNIAEEKSEEWKSFIPNEQFNNVLRTVIKSVRGNDIDNHKSFWINGTYGTGKSHAVAVISHLLGDPVEDIQDWLKEEFADNKFQSIRNAIQSLRNEKRLLTVKLYGLGAMSNPLDLALVLQKAVVSTLKAQGINIQVHTDFENHISHIEQNHEIWEHLIGNHTALSSIVDNSRQLVQNLKNNDLGTFHKMTDALRESGFDIRMNNESIKQWLIEVQNELAAHSDYNGLLIVWDEFTDVMTNAIGMPVLKELQEIVEKFANEENNSYMFLISHPSAFDKFNTEQLKQTDGRYHRMKYNMESVSAFKIMSRKFRVEDDMAHYNLYHPFYSAHPELLEIFTQTSNNRQETQDDLKNLFPLHPGTANLATHYATVVGSSSRSVFEFLGQNDAIKIFLGNEDAFLNRDTITADYLWDYVLKVFQDDATNYGAVTERYNSYRLQVANMGAAHTAIFKGILLLNAFNNVSGENNNGLVTPSEDNIRALFTGTRYEEAVDEVLQWFHDQGIIQRAPGGLYSVQFSALPSGEIEEKKKEMLNVQYKYTDQILTFSTDTSNKIFEKNCVPRVIRPNSYNYYSDRQNESLLRDKIKNGRRNAKSSSLFFALLFARNNQELMALREFAEHCASDQDDKDLRNIIFVVFDEVMTDRRYEQFIEYQANYACASSHGFVDQQTAHRDHAVEMVKEWMEAAARNNAMIYINGEPKPQTVSMKNFSIFVNAAIAPGIFPYGPDTCEILRQKAPATFWSQKNSKEIVRNFLFAKTKTDISEKVTAQMRPIQYLIQDCLDDNLQWKEDTPENHPFKKVCDRIDSIIKYANKSNPFNFDDKFHELTAAPYGLYSNFAAMAMVAFAMRSWEGKIFDMQGKPRDKNALVDDIALLFKVWDDNKSSSKLTFKFQTPEEGKLCKSLVSLFRLNSKDNAYSDVSSLKDARYAITAEFLGKKNSPLWAIKYAPPAAFEHLPVRTEITDDIKKLVDNIVLICTERELRNPALVTETLEQIDELRIDLKNILNVDAAFTEGFKSFLMQIELIALQENEIDAVKEYIGKNLQSTVGYWTEAEVTTAARSWRLSQLTNPPQPPVQPTAPPVQPVVHPEIMAEKRKKAKERIAGITTLQDAISLLNSLCDEGDEWLLNKINS